LAIAQDRSLKGRFLYAANEEGDTVVTFAPEAGIGKLTPTGQVV
jgi:6-phosphogluconolactonase (cycloisomerase 2 family)